MKDATLPAVRVTPALRKTAEKLLRPGESLSGFVEDAVQQSVERRKADADFLARALRSEAQAKKTGRYVTPEETLAKLAKMAAKTKKRRP